MLLWKFDLLWKKYITMGKNYDTILKTMERGKIMVL